MKGKFRAPKGFQDIIPPSTFVWQYIEGKARSIFGNYGYQEIRVPIVEHTEIFVRSIGETTDIVEKEMYTFRDRAERSLTLRPEGTAPVVRSYVQNGLYARPDPQKYYYSGPMFRYERPQKGRFRQFYQIGAEAFGIDDPYIDAEVLSMLQDFLFDIGLKDLNYEINSIGCPECRPDYREALKKYLSRYIDKGCEDCKRRFNANPLRILDCKVPDCSEIALNAPVIKDYLCGDCKDHLRRFREHLDSSGVQYEINSRLVRGLDYYTRTIFEITTAKLGSQNAVVAGGRYDGLVEDFGGPSVPAVGFAIGMERLVELASDADIMVLPEPSVFVVWLGSEAHEAGIKIVQRLRSRGVWCEINYGKASLKSQLKKADKMSSQYVFIIGDDEIKAGKVKYKRMSDGEEGDVSFDDFDSMIVILTNGNK